MKPQTHGGDDSLVVPIFLITSLVVALLLWLIPTGYSATFWKIAILSFGLMLGITLIWRPQASHYEGILLVACVMSWVGLLIGFALRGEIQGTTGQEWLFALVIPLPTSYFLIGFTGLALSARTARGDSSR